MATYNSGSYISTDNGKFRLECDVTVSSAGIVVTPKIHISNAFKSAQTFQLTYYANNTTKKTKKTAANGTTKKYKNVGTHKLTTFTIKSYSVTKAISLKVNGKTAKIAGGTIKSTLAPPTPNISVSQSKPTIWNITVSGTGEEEQPVNVIYLEYTNLKSPSSGDWNSLTYANIGYHPSDNNTKAYSHTFSVEVEQNQFYIFRARVSGSKTGTEKFSAFTTTQGMVTRPEETDDVAMDEQAQTITWTAELNDIDKGVVKGWYIYRAEGDSESYSQVDTVNAVVGQVYYSWTESASVTGHAYKYKVVAFNNYGESWDTSAIVVDIEGEPYAPSTSDIKYYYNGDGSVSIVTTLGEGVETTYIERSNDGGETWVQIAALTAPANSYTDNAATSTSIYRVKFGNNAGTSDYSDAFQPAASVIPSPPTILLPVFHSYRSLSEGTIEIHWQHNTLDGSPQAAANVIITKLDDTPLVNDTVDSSSNVYSWNVGLLSPTGIKIQVRTKGANNLWSGFAINEFYLVSEPQIQITAPTGIQTTLPVSLDFTYTPSVGGELLHSYLKELSIVAIDEEGEVVYRKNIDYVTAATTPFSDSISLMDALFSSDIEYTLQVMARETNGLISSHVTTFTVEYTDEALEGSLYPIVGSDEETGYVYVQIARDIGDDGETEPAPVVKAYLYRNANSERILLGEVEDSDQIVDKLAPVNKDFTYDLLQLYQDGTASLITVDAYNPSSYSFIYWGNKLDKIASAIWNPEQSTSMGRPERTLVRYSGRKYPVVYDSKARSEIATFNAVLEPEELDEFIAIMHAGGVGIWKSVQGRTFNASFDLDFERVESSYNLELYKCTLKVERVEE